MNTKLLRRMSVAMSIGACGLSFVSPALAQFAMPGSDSLRSGQLVPAQQAPSQQYPGSLPFQGQFQGQSLQAPTLPQSAATMGFQTPHPHSGFQQPGFQQPAYQQPGFPTQPLPPAAAYANQGFAGPANVPAYAAAPQASLGVPTATQPPRAGAATPTAAAADNVAARWSNFNAPSAIGSPYRTVSNAPSMAPVPEPVPAPAPDMQYGAPYTPGSSYAPPAASAYAGPAYESPAYGYAAPAADCQSCNTGYSSPYAAAAASNWGDGDCGTGACAPAFAARPAIYPWFGSFNLLFLNVANNSSKPLGIYNGLPGVFSNTIAPDNGLGYEVGVGRYLGCGTYGLGVQYFNFDPDREMTTVTGVANVGGAGPFRATMQAYHDYHLDLDGDGAANQVYQHITGMDGAGNPLAAVGGSVPQAVAIRARRDVRFQGIEANLFSFGLMGAQRAAPACGDGYQGPGWYNKLMGVGNHHTRPGFGYGGAAGPLVRPETGRVQVVTSHGFRWFEFQDHAELAYNTDGLGGYGTGDIYDNVDVSNNLLGYQFGGRLIYCLTNRVNFAIGGKFGVYGNQVEARRRVGTQDTVAYRFGMPNDLALTEQSDTVLSTLGELDLGLGYRLSNAWTVRGGYRVMGITGVASSLDQMNQDFSTSDHLYGIHADDSILLHGAYVGATFNF